MVKVHIWLAHGSMVGHTALTVKDTYISFWPDGNAGKKDLKLKRSQPGMFMQDLYQDIYNEGGREPITIELKNLDPEKILNYVQTIQESIPRYQIASNNCSYIAAKALMAGADCKPSFTPNAGSYSKIGHLVPGIWTPDQVLRFANELKQL